MGVFQRRAWRRREEPGDVGNVRSPRAIDEIEQIVRSEPIDREFERLDARRGHLGQVDSGVRCAIFTCMLYYSSELCFSRVVQTQKRRENCLRRHLPEIRRKAFAPHFK
jgi:hypothetical protein